MKPEFPPQISEIYKTTKFYENPSGGAELFLADRQT
jgi:hypothetical protein